jgi:small-conductance mechanosensitive channel
MSRPSSPDLNLLADSLLHPSALIEMAVLAGCVIVSWAVVRTIQGRRAQPSSVLFGDRAFDGALFPVLALLLAFGARALLALLDVPVALMRLAIPVLVSLAVIRLTVRVLQLAFPASRAIRTVERTVSWVAWIGMVLWVTGVLPMVMQDLEKISWKMGSAHITLRNLVEGTLSAVLVLMLALWLSAVIEARLIRGASAANLSLRKIAASAVRALLLFAGLLLALSAAGIDLTALSVLGGAVGVGLGFGLQKIAANYVSGFVILAEHSLRIGDMVKIDGFEGRITDIRTRYTVIRALSGREAIVPNEQLITQRVENLSLADSRVSISTSVQVAYGTDVRALLPQIVQVVTSVPRVIADPAPSALLSDFGADGIDLTVSFWIQDPENGLGGVRSDVNLAVLDLLNARRVQIPFPQRVVHMQPNVQPARRAEIAIDD